MQDHLCVGSSKPPNPNFICMCFDSKRSLECHFLWMFPIPFGSIGLRTQLGPWMNSFPFVIYHTIELIFSLQNKKPTLLSWNVMEILATNCDVLWFRLECTSKVSLTLNLGWHLCLDALKRTVLWCLWSGWPKIMRISLNTWIFNITCSIFMGLNPHQRNTGTHVWLQCQY